jgi:riboflavin biosynthesis pyrimidine reductase
MKPHVSMLMVTSIDGRLHPSRFTSSPDGTRRERPLHVAKTDAATFAVALDPSGKLHFQGGKLSGDHLIVLLGRETSDSHLAELAADGVSYIVSEGAEFDIPRSLDTLAREFGITHVVVKDAVQVSGCARSRRGSTRVFGIASRRMMPRAADLYGVRSRHI